ncbi:MAG: hypothetical protein KBD16_02905 [Candidatus Pacebacteria bacterium]|nr:hypothetical protein [Candidatus Paceibacterota bacterium]
MHKVTRRRRRNEEAMWWVMALIKTVAISFLVYLALPELVQEWLHSGHASTQAYQ